MVESVVLSSLVSGLGVGGGDIGSSSSSGSSSRIARVSISGCVFI